MWRFRCYVPNLRFRGYCNPWSLETFSSCFEYLSNNALSRESLNYFGGSMKNIHYGDILINLPTVVSFSDHRIPFINEKISVRHDILKQGDIVIADTAEDYEVGKALEILSEDGLKAVAGLHTIPCRPKVTFAQGYLAYYLGSPAHKRRLLPLIQGIKVYGISKRALSDLPIFFPTIEEQKKISDLFITIDRKIEAQNKIIEKYESLIKQLNNDLFSRDINCKIGDFIQECSKRNKNGAFVNVLSVSNKNGFVKQSEQFEDKELASEDKTNYKIVQKGDFAFNPARINVGSIALLKNQETGIVSPMYICFKAKNLPNEVLEFYFLSSSFKKEMNKRLEGSVRMCLTIDGMKNIRFHKPDEKEVNLLNHLTKLKDFVSTNRKILDLYNSQKKYLLSNLFI